MGYKPFLSHQGDQPISPEACLAFLNAMFMRAPISCGCSPSAKRAGGGHDDTRRKSLRKPQVKRGQVNRAEVKRAQGWVKKD